MEVIYGEKRAQTHTRQVKLHHTSHSTRNGRESHMLHGDRDRIQCALYALDFLYLFI